MNKLDELNKYISRLSLTEIENLTDDQILMLAMERPGHHGQYGFMLQLPYFKSPDHLSETMFALMKRLQHIDNLNEKMSRKTTNRV
jgi:hypothetical protein